MYEAAKADASLTAAHAVATEVAAERILAAMRAAEAERQARERAEAEARAAALKAEAEMRAREEQWRVDMARAVETRLPSSHPPPILASGRVANGGVFGVPRQHRAEQTFLAAAAQAGARGAGAIAGRLRAEWLARLEMCREETTQKAWENWVSKRLAACYEEAQSWSRLYATVYLPHAEQAIGSIAQQMATAAQAELAQLGAQGAERTAMEHEERRQRDHERAVRQRMEACYEEAKWAGAMVARLLPAQEAAVSRIVAEMQAAWMERLVMRREERSQKAYEEEAMRRLAVLYSEAYDSAVWLRGLVVGREAAEAAWLARQEATWAERRAMGHEEQRQRAYQEETRSRLEACYLCAQAEAGLWVPLVHARARWEARHVAAQQAEWLARLEMTREEARQRAWDSWTAECLQAAVVGCRLEAAWLLPRLAQAEAGAGRVLAALQTEYAARREMEQEEHRQHFHEEVVRARLGEAYHAHGQAHLFLTAACLRAWTRVDEIAAQIARRRALEATVDQEQARIRALRATMDQKQAISTIFEARIRDSHARLEAARAEFEAARANFDVERVGCSGQVAGLVAEMHAALEDLEGAERALAAAKHELGIMGPAPAVPAIVQVAESQPEDASIEVVKTSLGCP
ncbi:hypothetical protein PAPYR_10120 [Paratrimastix pyriformis]|uniref:Uncharacterized protein n=1 Tax=Paratrimastix pyriformis TaxID=342808 RepID=A0ABQ8UCE1_9EUKA|nr:hypothetical protein PAPYR_10120 [Paratrimastix pyriformis]